MLFATPASAHPGGGIVAVSDDSAVFADSVENTIWLVERNNEPKRLVSKFHGHWITRGLDGGIYVEAFQESGGAWNSSAFRLDPSTGKLTEVATGSEIDTLTFAVDRDGSLVFQRGPTLVAFRDGRESPFRPHPDRPALRSVTAYAWGPAGELFYADRDRIFRVDPGGRTSSVARIEGKVLEPKIWNATDTPSIFGLAVDGPGTVLVAVPDLGKVYRVEPGKDGALEEVAAAEDRWRATGVATSGGSVFLMESDPRTSESPRVRISRPSGAVEILTVPRPSE